jgi:hypothetical protein
LESKANLWLWFFFQINELGQSLPSEAVAFSTQGSAPPAPLAPELQEATKSSLHLLWAKRICDEDFILQMEDAGSGHGFLPLYNGAGSSYKSQGLRRNTAYRFRLQAINEEGKSPWSQETCFWTLPDVPGPPQRPASKVIRLTSLIDWTHLSLFEFVGPRPPALLQDALGSACRQRWRTRLRVHPRAGRWASGLAHRLSGK